MSKNNKENLSSSLEDYLEVIYTLTECGNVARSKDIADEMNVSRASVTGALKTLSEKGFVNYRPYAYTTLTESGSLLAERIVKRHKILSQFFESVLGAEIDIAEAAACKAEHTLGPEITSRLMSFIEFISKNRDGGNNITQQFQNYWQQCNET